MKKRFTCLRILCLLVVFPSFAQDQSVQFDEATGRWGTAMNESFTALVVNPTDAFLGIESNEISRAKANKLGFSNPYGTYISKVLPNTTADKAGLLPFDYLYGIGEYRTTRQSSIGDLLEEYEPNDWVALHLIRAGEKVNIQAQLDVEKEREFEEMSNSNQAFLGISRIGQRTDDMSGVAVNILANSTAQSIGMQNGDKITHINQHLMLDWEDISTAIGALKPQEEISVTFIRGNQSSTRSGIIQSYGTTQNEPLTALEEKNWENNYAQLERVEQIMEEQVEEVQQHHESAFLGINVAKLSRQKSQKLGFDNPYGTYVTSVIPRTAADKSGIKPLDYIYGVDEYRVGEHQDLGDILQKFRAGDRAEVLVSRRSQRKVIPVQFGSKNDKYGEKKRKNKCEDPFFGITNSSGSSEKGIQVNIVKNATSDRLGMKNGDIITHINGYRMVDWDDISIAINMMSPGEVITVDYLRFGQTGTLSAPIRSYAETKNCANCDCNTHLPDFSMDFNKDKIEEDIDQDLSQMQITIVDADTGDTQEFAIRGGDSSTKLVVNNLRVNPNIGRGLFELNFALPSEGETVVKIYNDKGRNIYEYDLGRFSGDFADEVNLAQNGKGAYLLNIVQDGQVLTKKILVK